MWGGKKRVKNYRNLSRVAENFRSLCGLFWKWRSCEKLEIFLCGEKLNFNISSIRVKRGWLDSSKILFQFTTLSPSTSLSYQSRISNRHKTSTPNNKSQELCVTFALNHNCLISSLSSFHSQPKKASSNVTTQFD
jgi:hypothetical protein